MSVSSFVLSVSLCLFALGVNAQAADLTSVEQQLALSNSYEDLFGCAVIVKSAAISAAKVYSPTEKEKASMDILIATFDDAFEFKSESLGKVDVSKHIPDFLSNSSGLEEFEKVQRSEHKYCMALHKIAVLERQVKYLNSAEKQ